LSGVENGNAARRQRPLRAAGRDAAESGPERAPESGGAAASSPTAETMVTASEAVPGIDDTAAPQETNRPSGEPLLAVRDLRVFYGAAAALRGISFDVYEGEVVTIIGGNGAGKSTTLRTVSGVSELLKTVQGTITFAGRRVEKRPAHRIAAMGMAHIPEGRRVFAGSTVEENLILGGYRRRKDRSTFATDIAAIYERFPVLGQRRNQPAGLLSGGEQQMLAIGRGLMSQPRFLLLDEPSLGLAPLLVAEVFRIIKQLADEGTTILLVEQMAMQALDVADRAYVLETGTITAEGRASELAADPAVRAAYLGA
jgi:ABC-type branched-subunit amino acid transport system ATPase component